MHFLSTSYALMTIEELQKSVPLHVTSQDFLLGVADLTGEVMRWGCIGDIRQNGARELTSFALLDTASTTSGGRPIPRTWLLRLARWRTLSGSALQVSHPLAGGL